jgi:hypothetical protein
MRHTPCRQGRSAPLQGIEFHFESCLMPMDRKSAPSSRFSYGGHNEIIPEPLVVGFRPREVIAYLNEVTGEGHPHDSEDEELLGRAIPLFHNWRLAQMFDRPINQVEERYTQAVNNGARLNILPLTWRSSAMRFWTFAPVIMRISDTGWLLGEPGFGKSAIVTGEMPSDGVANAINLVEEWVLEELETVSQIYDRQRSLQEALKHLSQSGGMESRVLIESDQGGPYGVECQRYKGQDLLIRVCFYGDDGEQTLPTEQQIELFQQLGWRFNPQDPAQGATMLGYIKNEMSYLIIAHFICRILYEVYGLIPKKQFVASYLD